MRFDNQNLIDDRDSSIGVKEAGGCSLREYQLRVLEILKEIDRICKKHNIQYFLAYGTLVGAVRHHGFVPWDDDCDILISRNQYIKLQEACNKELSDRYDFVNYLQKDGSGYTVTKIRDKETTYILKSEITRHGRNAGIYVDVIVFDYLSDNRFMSYIQKRTLYALHRLVSPGFSQGIDHLNAAEDFVLSLSKLIFGKKRSIRNCERILSCVPVEKASSILVNLVQHRQYALHIFDKQHFLSAQYVPFEDTELPIPEHAITFLNNSYGRVLASYGILLEHKYDDELAQILKGDFFRYNDIMYIPKNRNRGAHGEVAFHVEHGSAFFDEQYSTLINAKKNDRAAIKERAYREKGAKYLKIMSTNTSLADIRCKEILFREIRSKNDIDRISDEERVKICDCLLTVLGFPKMSDLSEEEFEWGISLLVREGFLVGAKRVIQRYFFLNPDLQSESITRLQLKMEELLEGYYAIFEENREVIERLLSKYSKDDCLIVELLKGVIKYWNGDHEGARLKFTEMLDISPNDFLALYFMGEIEKECKNYEKAKAFYRESIDTTLYMPLLQLSISRIREIEDEENQ